MESIFEQYNAPIPPPMDDSAKEVFTYYGLASYWAQLLEKGYVQLSVSLGILEIELPSTEHHDRLRTKFEKFTLGTLLDSANEMITLPNELKQLSLESLDKRNYLIHHYFWRHSEDLLSKKGRKLMIDELIILTKLFRQTDKILNVLLMNLLNKQGITEKDVLEIVDDMINKADARDVS